MHLFCEMLPARLCRVCVLNGISLYPLHRRRCQGVPHSERCVRFREVQVTLRIIAVDRTIFNFNLRGNYVDLCELHHQSHRAFTMQTPHVAVARSVDFIRVLIKPHRS